MHIPSSQGPPLPRQHSTATPAAPPQPRQSPVGALESGAGPSSNSMSPRCSTAATTRMAASWSDSGMPTAVMCSRVQAYSSALETPRSSWTEERARVRNSREGLRCSRDRSSADAPSQSW